MVHITLKMATTPNVTRVPMSKLSTRLKTASVNATGIATIASSQGMIKNKL